MILVVSPDILLQAIAVNEHIRRLILESSQLNLTLNAPEILQREVEETVDRWAASVFSLREKYLADVMELYAHIKLALEESYAPSFSRALAMTSLPAYAPYVALALAIGATGIWSDAPRFLKEGVATNQFTTAMLKRTLPDVAKIFLTGVEAEQVLSPGATQAFFPASIVPSTVFDPVRDAAVTPEYVTNYLTYIGLKCISDDDQERQPRYYLNLGDDRVDKDHRPLPDLKSLPPNTPLVFIEVDFDPVDEEGIPEEKLYTTLVTSSVKKTSSEKQYWHFFISPDKYITEEYSTINYFLEERQYFKVFFKSLPNATPPPVILPTGIRREPPPLQTHIAFTPEQAGFTTFRGSSLYQPPLTTAQAFTRWKLREKHLKKRGRHILVSDKIFDATTLRNTLSAKEDNRLDVIRTYDFNEID